MFNLQLDRVEAKEKEDALAGFSVKAMKPSKKLGGSKKKEMLNAAETKPSPQGRRIIPKIDLKLKEKFEKETLSKENKGKRVSIACSSEDLMFIGFRFFFHRVLRKISTCPYLYCVFFRFIRCYSFICLLLLA
jgi:hypothetical protein